MRNVGVHIVHIFLAEQQTMDITFWTCYECDILTLEPPWCKIYLWTFFKCTYSNRFSINIQVSLSLTFTKIVLFTIPLLKFVLIKPKGGHLYL